MAKPFANSKHFSGEILDTYLIGIQAGQHTNADGLPEMMYVRASELRAFMREGMASVYNYRGAYNTLPTDLAVGDTFYASSTFTEDGDTYTQGHLYAWNGSSWDDITNIFTQYYVKADKVVGAVADDLASLDADGNLEDSGISKSYIYGMQTEIDNLKARGRFLSLWNCTTGLPVTDPLESPYPYKAGDYYIVSVVGATNYKPTGSSYTIGVASTVVETAEVAAGDFYEFDGTNWMLLSNTQKTVTFSQIQGNATDNLSLATELGNKVPLFTVDSTAWDTKPTKASTKPVTSGGVEQAISVEDGDLVEVKGTGTVPSSANKYSMIHTLKGVSRVENNHLPIPTSSISQTVNGVTIVDNRDGSYTFSNTATANTIINIITHFETNLTSGHYYLLCGMKDGSGVRMIDSYGTLNLGNTQADKVFTIADASQTVNLSFYITNGTSVNVTLNPNIVDLNQYFNTSDLSFLGGTDSAKLAKIQSDHPELLEPRAYNAGEIVDSTYTKVESVGKNLAEINDFTQSTSYGQTVPCNLRKGITYTVSGSASGGSTIRLLKSDGSYQYVAVTATINATFVAEDDISEVSFYGSLSVSNLQIEQGSSKTTFSEYHTPATLTIPSVTLKGAGSVSDTLDVESGVVTRNVGSVDLGTLTWTYSSAALKFEAPYTGMKSVDAYTVAELTCDSYLPASAVDLNSNEYDLHCASINGVKLQVKNLSKTGSDLTDGHASWLEGVMLNYELATPTTELVEPTRDNFIEVEIGGTIEASQDNDPKIDTDFVVSYPSDIRSAIGIAVGNIKTVPDDMVTHTDDLAGSAVPINSDQLNGHPDTYFSQAGNIAVVETSPATQAHAVGALIVYNGKLYKVTSAIAINDALTEGTNITSDTVASELSTVNSAITSLIIRETKTGTTASNGYVSVPAKTGYTLISAYATTPSNGYCCLVAKSDSEWVVFLVGFSSGLPTLPYANKSVSLELIWAKV